MTTPAHAGHVYVSAKNETPKYHLSLDCSSFDIMRDRGMDPAEVLAVETVPGWAFFETNRGRACRTCALGPIASHVLARQGDEPTTFASMTSQVPLAERAFTKRGALRRSYNKEALTAFSDSGAERLREIAAATGYDVVGTVAGPALFGQLPVRAHHFAELNLRTSFGPAVADCPSPEVVSIAWALLCNRPPEILAHYGEEVLYDDPWALALAAAQ